MLLMTAKGERPMMPTYGSDLRSLLFNPAEEDYDELLKEAVRDATEKWMPEVIILEVDITRDISTAPNSATIQITFSLSSIPDSYEKLEIEVS
jgi:phage baseplate assembly protein W